MTVGEIVVDCRKGVQKKLFGEEARARLEQKRWKIVELTCFFSLVRARFGLVPVQEFGCLHDGPHRESCKKRWHCRNPQLYFYKSSSAGSHSNDIALQSLLKVSPQTCTYGSRRYLGAGRSQHARLILCWKVSRAIPSQSMSVK